MRKIYILALLLLACMSAFANTTMITYNVKQGNWRWRNDDGSEMSASWKAGQNKPVSYGSKKEVIRLRIEIINTSTYYNINCEGCQFPNPINMFDSLQFSTNIINELSWKNIGLNTDMPFVLAGSDSYVVQDEPTTPQLTGTDAPFSPGTIMINDSTINGTLVLSPGRTEHEWVIRGTANLAPNTTYYFRQHYEQNGTQYVNYPYPSLTTTATLAIQLNTFVVTNDGKRIRLQWSANPDGKADYTNIQRSKDQQVWTTISSIKSTGTSYTEYDNNPPLAGIIYYRLQQYDKDGSYSFSATRSVKTFPTGKAVVSVQPNPATAAINFKLENTAVKNVEAMLITIDGRVLLTQAFKNIQAGTLNRLNLSKKVAPGVYLLKLKGDGFLESIKIVVQ